MGHADPENLLFETSPYGSLDAIVEHDGRAVFFYLSGQGRSDDKFGTRACWVRNLVPGPFVINEDEMKEGVPPALPRTHCKYSDGRPVPKTDELEIVWFEEGNGAALIETPESGIRTTLAVIPPWSGLEGFHGYADECAAENAICWPMPTNPQLFKRINRAREFWDACQSTDEHPFTQLQEEILASYKSVMGCEVNYFAIDGGHFPPRGLATYESGDDFMAATVGMSLCPQPIVEMHVGDPKNFRRVEIAIRLKGSIEMDAKNRILQQISGLAAMPWRNWTWLGPKHTCGFDSLSTVLANDFQNVRIERDGWQPEEKMTFELPSFREDPVNLLWLIPVAGPIAGHGNAGH